MPEERYTISYYGYLFVGDKEDDYNFHYTDDWKNAVNIYNAYPDIVAIDDHLTGMTLRDGAWG